MPSPVGVQVLRYLDDQIDVHALPTRGCCPAHALNEGEKEFGGYVAPGLGGRKVVPVRISQRAIEGVFGEVNIGHRCAPARRRAASSRGHTTRRPPIERSWRAGLTGLDACRHEAMLPQLALWRTRNSARQVSFGARQWPPTAQHWWFRCRLPADKAQRMRILGSRHGSPKSPPLIDAKKRADHPI